MLQYFATNSTLTIYKMRSLMIIIFLPECSAFYIHFNFNTNKSIEATQNEVWNCLILWWWYFMRWMYLSLSEYMFVQRHIYLLIRIELGTWIREKMTQSWLQTKKKLDENLQEITSNLVLLTGNASAIRPNHKTSIPTFVGFISALLFNQDTIYIYSSVVCFFSDICDACNIYKIHAYKLTILVYIWGALNEEEQEFEWASVKWINRLSFKW